MSEPSNTLPVWEAPRARGPIVWDLSIPGSKSITNRALILSAIAAYPSTISGVLRSRDTDLMADALRTLGVEIEEEAPDKYRITPAVLTSGTVECGLAGTVMRFVPPVAALADGPVHFDGDAQARVRPMSTILDALRTLGVAVEGDRLPFVVQGSEPEGGVVEIDASGSSQFVSGLLLAAARYKNGITVKHTGARLPSMPHIEMSVDMLREAGVEVDTSVPNQWTVMPGTIEGRHWRIEPDLSNATPFLAAAAVTGGTVRIKNWPVRTTQPGDAIRSILTDMGCQVELIVEKDSQDLEVRGPAQLQGLRLDMSDIGELTPTVAALAALAHSESILTGISHLRGHETNRLEALTTQINNLGGECSELEDGLHIKPAKLHGGLWNSYADHRMATAGAILGLRIDDLQVEDIETTAKTLPGFAAMWEEMVSG